MSKSTFLRKKQLLKLINSLPGTVYQYRRWPNGKHTFPYSTQAIEEIFFHSPAALAKDASIAWAQLTPESRQELEVKIKRSIETLDAFEIVFETRSPQNRLHWIRNTALPETQRDGSTLWYGYMENITREHEEEIAAKQKGALLNLLFEKLPDHIYYKDCESRILGANPAYYDFHGFDRNKSINGKNDFNFYPQQDAQRLFDEEQSLMQKGESVETEEEHVSEDGRTLHIESFKCPLKSPSGQVIGLAGISRDVTERIENKKSLIRAKQESEENAALINAIFETLPDQIYYKDAKAQLLGANPAYCDFHGFDSEKPMLGKTCQQLYPVQFGQQIYNKEISLLTSGEPLRERERHTQKDKTSTYLESIKRPLKNSQGEIIGLVGISRDITEQVGREKELIIARQDAEAASKAKSSFLAMMSHEIRTPMNGVIGAASLLMGTRLNAMQEEFVHTIQTSGDNLLSIINDILDYSKIEAGKIELETIAFSPRECVEDAFDIFVQTAAKKNLELLCDIEPDVPECLRGDPTRLRQIVINLLGNAIKFTEEGEVGVKVSVLTFDEIHQECLLQFDVRDTGIGISEEAQKRLFKSFTQADASSTRKYGGTGLGLAISRRLTELMGGKITLTSKENEGSTFSFTANLPIAVSTKKTTEICKADLHGKRVLLVDDNQTNRRILTEQVKQWGAIPEAFAHPEQVIAHLQESAPYDIALLDYQMPTMNGETLAREIYNLPDLPELPVIILSSSCEIIKPHPSISARMTKPVKMHKLREQILELMGEHNQHKETVTRSGPHAHHKKHKNLRILIAEDNRVNQRVVQMMLQRLGYEDTVFVENGLEAVAASLDSKYDIVLMDVQMPKMNGLDATRKIRENSGSKIEPWIIALTAGVMEDERKNITLSGMNDFLAKPLAIEQLEEMLNKLES